MTVPTLSGFEEMLMRMGAALVLPTFIGQSGVFFAEGAAWGVRQHSIWYGIICGLENQAGDDAIASRSKPRFRSKFDERLCPAVAMRYSICARREAFSDRQKRQ